MKKMLFLPGLLLAILLLSGCTTESLFFFTKTQPETSECYKASLGSHPYWYECNGNKVTQTVPSALAEITYFTVFPEQNRVFWEYSDKENKNFYSNNFTGDSLLILNVKPHENEAIKEFTAGNTGFLDILKKTNRLLYILAEKNALGEIVAERIFSNTLQGNATKEITQEQNSLQQIECLNFENGNLFWFLEEKDAKGNTAKALYHNSVDGNKIALASYIAKPCNPKEPSAKSSEIRSLKGCTSDTFYSQGGFVFWVYSSIWNSGNCKEESRIEAIYATYMPENYVKNLTQYATISNGDYLELINNGIDIEGNRFFWVYYAGGTKQIAMYYNCLKGAGVTRIIDGSTGNIAKDIVIENNTVYWKANNKDFSAPLQECPN